MDARSKQTSVDEYVQNLPPATRKVLQDVRGLIKDTAPEAAERISYGIPVFELNGKYMVYLAGWKKHISIYPVTAGLQAALGDELKTYQSGKGTLQFPLNRPIPRELIRRIVEARIEEMSASNKR